MPDQFSKMSFLARCIFKDELWLMSFLRHRIFKDKPFGSPYIQRWVFWLNIFSNMSFLAHRIFKDELWRPDFCDFTWQETVQVDVVLQVLNKILLNKIWICENQSKITFCFIIEWFISMIIWQDYLKLQTRLEPFHGEVKLNLEESIHLRMIGSISMIWFWPNILWLVLTSLISMILLILILTAT